MHACYILRVYVLCLISVRGYIKTVPDPIIMIMIELITIFSAIMHACMIQRYRIIMYKLCNYV